MICTVLFTGSLAYDDFQMHVGVDHIVLLLRKLVTWTQLMLFT
jgi:hypothetical protein